MTTLYYENSKGQIIDFMTFPFRLMSYDGDSYELEYELTESSLGSKINKFKRTLQKKSMTLLIKSDTIEQRRIDMDTFFEITNYDVDNLTPGKLWKNNQYMECYFMAVDNEALSSNSMLLKKTIVIVSENPTWITESKFEYAIASESVGGIDFPFDYAHDYATTVRNDRVINNHYVPIDFVMRIYGACDNPYVYIAGHLYQVNVTLYDNDYLEIDSKKGTIINHKSNGTTINCFNMRNKQSSVFEKIPIGNNFVTWSGQFSFDIILRIERSEPKWSLS
ncbi:hypothetical protein [Anaerosacchariphilus polymeriproducens]|uniref:Phage tail protein n=1 Tax=Anaerosacchariphilus polymeriproducens TaxID=1812858 RepID=A0A371AT57_9FIRM|nr:hypothetical protein [Anaerosacchariphilus polymeriproducens]RDU22756.1 hypothetical protein DWV06_13385 [Anaerosacchariphilus polymeriproducens]